MDPRRRPPSTSHEMTQSTTNQTTRHYFDEFTTSKETGTANYTSYNATTTTTPYASNSNPLNTTNDTDTESRPRTVYQSLSRPGTARPGTSATTRPRTGYSTLGVENQEIICAVCESRGVAPSVGLAFVNLDTTEVVLCQLNDTQTYVRTIHKLAVFNPTNVLIVTTASNPESKLFSIISDDMEAGEYSVTLLERKYWSENAGLDYIQYHAFHEDVESLKTAVTGNYYAVCSFAAVLKYTELALSKKFPAHSLRIKYEPSEGSMMIDLATIQSLELVRNLSDPKSTNCLFGLLNETLTKMGARLLQSNILQPVTDPETLGKRYEAVEELSTKEDMFFAVRQALNPFLDADNILTQMIIIPTEATVKMVEQAVNHVISLKQIVNLVAPVFQALAGARSEMLQAIQKICASQNTDAIQTLIDSIINEDTAWAKKPLDLRNQRTYAVKSGVNGLLDVARQTYKESTDDLYVHINNLKDEHNLPLVTKFDHRRQFYLNLRIEDLESQVLPPIFINVYKKKGVIECQTLEIVKRNQKIGDAHMEVLLMSNEQVCHLIDNVREHMAPLFKICESVAMLDMLCSFAHVVPTQDYIRPNIVESGGTLAVRAGRHPIKEKIHNTKFVPNDIYASQQNRFQILTGCNMSGKSTYIRSIALMTIMAQVGSFVPAQNASFPIIRQLFARVSLDDSIEANVSTFAAEMREAAFILRNIDRSSMVIIDELGRGTSTRDGMAIALAIAEALVESRAMVWFATHFHDLANIMSERNGVMNLHLAVNNDRHDQMEMLYRISPGTVADEHYGLKLARILPLPADVFQVAEEVSRSLERQHQKRKEGSIGIFHARRRKLILNLREHLVQAREGRMNDKNLELWLKELQKEFVVRMTALDDEIKSMLSGQRGDDDEGKEMEETEYTGTVLDDQTEGETVTGMITASREPRTFIGANGVEWIDLTEIEDSTGESIAGSSSGRYFTATS